MRVRIGCQFGYEAATSGSFEGAGPGVLAASKRLSVVAAAPQGATVTFAS